MDSKKQALIYGFLSWLLPFLFSVLFYSKEGQLLINYDLFKTIMVVSGTLSGVILLILYFKSIRRNYLKNAVVVGVIWFAANIILDTLILVPMSKMLLADYFYQIGLRYLAIPIISIGFGYLLQSKS